MCKNEHICANIHAHICCEAPIYVHTTQQYVEMTPHICAKCSIYVCALQHIFTVWDVYRQVIYHIYVHLATYMCVYHLHIYVRERAYMCVLLPHICAVALISISWREFMFAHICCFMNIYVDTYMLNLGKICCINRTYMC